MAHSESSRGVPRFVVSVVLAVAVAVGTVVSVGATPASAQPLVSLPDTVIPAVAGAHRVGALDGATKLSVAVDLTLHNADQLARLDTDVSTPGSPLYGHFLTPDQFTRQFGPATADVDLVRAFLTSAGLVVTGVSGNRQVVDAAGSAAQMSAAFHTTLGNYTKDGKTFYANDGAISVPPALASVISGVTGLDDHTVSYPHASPQAGPVGGLSPAQLNGAYRFNQLGTNGAGVTVALWELDGYKQANLTTYDSQYGLSGPAVTTVAVDGAAYDSAPGTGQFEVELDSEVVRAIAPAATQLVYEAPNTGPGAIDMANKIVSDGRASVISISWGACEQEPSASYITAINKAFSQAVAQGMSIYSASGDDGSRDCARTATGSGVKAVDFPGSSVYDTSVGGTTLNLASDGGYGTETAWGSGGGGVSTMFAKPSWQTAGSGSMRTVPDVSSEADPNTGVSTYINGAWTLAGGTSAAAPTWAALTALYNQKAVAAGKSRLGFANPALYQIGQSQTHASALHDVTTGSNGDYAAAVGYDDTTGLGTPIGDGLAAALLAGTATTGNTVTVTAPANQSTVVGASVSVAVTATDSASAALTYTASGLPAGLSINASTGVISGRPTAVGTSSVTVTATDATKAAGSAVFTWAVTSAANAVTVTSPGSQSTAVGASVSLAVSASDSSTGAVLTYTASGLPPGLSINASTGVISGKPTAAGTSTVTVTATDAANASGTASFMWTVTGTAYTVSMANPGSQSTAVGASVSLALNAVSSSGAAVTYTASGLPAGLSIDASTGVISGKPTAAGSSSVSVTATDATKAYVTVAFAWTVTAAASTVSMANPGNQSSVVGASVSLALNAVSSSGAALTYTASGLPAGLALNASTGVISGKPTAAGSSSVSVTATDATKAYVTVAFTWTVTAAASTVSMANPGNQSSVVGASVSLALNAVSSSGAALTYTVTGLPAGLSINASTGVVSGKPTAAGTSSVSVTATDATKAYVTVAFAWTVTAAAPTVSMANPGSQSTAVGASVSLALNAVSSSGAALTYTATGLPAGLALNASTGVISGKPTTAGTSSVTVTATDTTKAYSTVAFTWTVTGGSCASPGQKLGNPGFESGNTVWTASSHVIGQYASTGEPARTGTWDAWLDGFGATHTSTLSQSVTIPAGCTATLSFYLHVDTAETDKTTQYDKLTVKAGSTTLATFSNIDAATGYTLRSYSLSAFAGQTVALTFTGVEDSGKQTSFVIDDAAVTAG